MTDGYLPRHIQPDPTLSTVVCLHCGRSEQLAANVNVALDAIHDFVDEHTGCVVAA